jgi:type II secretory pathway pseudopilin PulG
MRVDDSTISRRCGGWSLLEVFFALMMGAVVLAALAHSYYVSVRLVREAEAKDRALGCAERIMADVLLHQSWPMPGEETDWIEDDMTGLFFRVRTTEPDLPLPGAVLVDVEVSRSRGGGELLVVLSSAGVPRVGGGGI